jgi:glycine/D-amino acid oxidase-like deaminating enzyme
MKRDDPLSYWQQTAAQWMFSSPLPPSADVVVVGGGLLGVATAYWAARTGVSVTLLERETLAAGATGRNGGFVGCGPDEPFHEAVARVGYETARAILDITQANRLLLHQVIGEEAIASDYREPGHLHLALVEAEQKAYREGSHALQSEGIQAVFLDRAEVQKLIQTPLGPEILGGLFVPEAGLVHSVQLVQGLGQAAQRYGVHAVEATVHQLRAESHRVCVETSRGTIHAGSVVLALNAWTGDLLPQLAQIVTPIRGQMLAYQDLPPVFVSGVTAALANAEVYWQQTPQGALLLGGCRTAAPGYDRGISSNLPTTEVQSALEQVFPRLFPDLTTHLHVAGRWAGVMAFTPDLLPVIDLVSHLPNTWVVGGFSGHGMPYGLRVGQLLAEAIIEGKHPDELFPFRLDRPTLR